MSMPKENNIATTIYVRDISDAEPEETVRACLKRWGSP